jgi:N-acetylneuraminic acid mutarotase
VGIFYTQTFTASGGVAPYTFSSTGTLPPGLTLVPSTGVLSGTPTTFGTFGFGITATDVNLCPGTRVYSVTITSPCVGNGFVNVANAPLDAYGSGAASDGGYAYFAGGYSFSASASVNQLIRYDPVANSWTSLANMPQALGMPLAANGGNGKLYMMGGTDATTGTAFNNVQIYDIATNTWSTGTVMPDLRAFASGGYYNGKIYVIGGYNTGNISPAFLTVWAYDIAGNSWNTALTPIPAVNGFGGAASGIINGKIYVAGGRDSTNTVINTTWIYDIAGDSWIAGANLPAADNVPASAVVNGQLWVMGGGNPFGPIPNPTAAIRQPNLVTTTSSVEIYDPTSNSWASGPALTQTLSFPSATQDNIWTVVYGGYNGSTTTAGTETIFHSAPFALPATLPGGAVGTPYSQSLTGGGGLAPYTFAVTAGSLPPGLSMDAAGNITGTPTTGGTFNFTVTVTDSNGCTGTTDYSIVITGGCPLITVLPATLPDGIVGTAYSQTVSGSGGTAPYTFAVTTGALPTGLSLNPSTGAITGTPTATGPFSFTITATDANLCTGATAYILTIDCPVITVLPATLPDGSVTTAYSQTVSASGGTAPYTFAVSAGALPTGLSLNPSTGAITGTPTVAGPFSFDITATDANVCDGSTSYTVNINAGGQVLRFFTIQPCRLIDTRRVTGTWGGPPLQAATFRDFPLDGQCGIPADAVAVSANMTAVLPTAGGDLRAFPTGDPMPSSSVINFNAGGIRANNIIVPLTGTPIGSMTIRCDMPSGSTNFLFDANGYFAFVSQ